MLGMTKRLRDGSITLDDHDAQSSGVARQVATGLFIVRIDLLIRDDYACNPLFNDLVIDFDGEPGSFLRSPEPPSLGRFPFRYNFSPTSATYPRRISHVLLGRCRGSACIKFSLVPSEFKSLTNSAFLPLSNHSCTFPFLDPAAAE